MSICFQIDTQHVWYPVYLLLLQRGRIIYGRFRTEHISFVVYFHRIFVNPIAKTDTIIETGPSSGHNLIH